MKNDPDSSKKRPRSPKRGETGEPPKPPSRGMEEKHKELMEACDVAMAAVKPDRDKMEHDIQFLHKRGGQWEDWATKARGDRPRPEINLVVKKAETVKGKQRQSRIDAKIRATGGGARVDIAETFEGLIRGITSNNRTRAARDGAFDEAVDCGVGAYCIKTDFESDESFSVQPSVASIRNARNSVFWTVEGTDGQHRDSSGCFVIDTISRSEFKRKWPKARAGDANFKGANGPHAGWSTSTTLQICDYWEKERYTRTLGQFKDAEGNEVVYEIDPDTLQIMDELAEEGVVLVTDSKGKPRTKKVSSYKVMHYVLSGSEILEGPSEFPCSMIPVVMVYGYVYWDTEGRHPYGVVRHAIDAQRKLNYEAGAMMEASALAAKDPIMATKEQIGQYKNAYYNLGATNPSVLLYNSDPAAASKAPFRLGAPSVQSALGIQLGQSEAYINGTMGIHDASVGNNPNAQSGRALGLLQQSGDNATFSINDSLGNGIAYETECLLDMLPKIWDREMQLRIVKDDGEEEEVKLVNKEVTDQQSGKVVLLKDFRLDRYDVTVDIGPNYATKRLENLQVLLQLGDRLGDAGSDIIAGELDISKAKEFSKRLRIQGILEKRITPNKEDLEDIVEYMQGQQQIAQLMQPLAPQPDPMAQAAAQMQLRNMENELLEGAAKIDETVSARVKDLVGSLKDIQDMIFRAPAMEARMQPAINSIVFEIQQALTSNDPQPQEQGMLAG